MVFDGAFREPYNLEEYGTGSRKKKKDRVIYSKFPYAEIHTLIGKMKLTKREKIIDNVLGFLTDAPFGTPELIKDINNIDKEFYLVEQNGEQLIVVITDEFIETYRLDEHVSGDKFELGEWKFVKSTYEVKKD